MRNDILHAVAVNTCGQWGTIDSFWSPKAGEAVERTDDVVQAVTAHAVVMHEQGLAYAQAVAERVNARIVATARTAAEATDEVQNPPQVTAPYPHEHVCRECDPNGRGYTTVRMGRAIVVWPREKFQRLKEEFAKPVAERDPSRLQG